MPALKRESHDDRKNKKAQLRHVSARGSFHLKSKNNEMMFVVIKRNPRSPRHVKYLAHHTTTFSSKFTARRSGAYARYYRART